MQMSHSFHDDPPRGCGTDVAAHALGALEQRDERLFRAHLATCAVCPDELAAFEQVVNALAMSAPRYPAPASLRGRVLAEVHRDAIDQASARRQRRQRRQHQQHQRRSPGWLPRPAIALSALLVVAAVILGATRLIPPPNPATRVLSAHVTDRSALAQITITAGRGELIIHHLSPAPSDEIYEVWLTRGGHRPQPTSALFNVTANGDGDVAVPGDLRHVQRIMVTPEPIGGTQRPTHPAVISADLT